MQLMVFGHPIIKQLDWVTLRSPNWATSLEDYNKSGLFTLSSKVNQHPQNHLKSYIL